MVWINIAASRTISFYQFSDHITLDGSAVNNSARHRLFLVNCSHLPAIITIDCWLISIDIDVWLYLLAVDYTDWWLWCDVDIDRLLAFDGREYWLAGALDSCEMWIYNRRILTVVDCYWWIEYGRFLTRCFLKCAVNDLNGHSHSWHTQRNSGIRIT